MIDNKMLTTIIVHVKSCDLIFSITLPQIYLCLTSLKNLNYLVDLLIIIKFSMTMLFVLRVLFAPLQRIQKDKTEFPDYHGYF